MKNLVYSFLALLLIGCTVKKQEFDLNGKWVLLKTELDGKDVSKEIIHSPLLSFTIQDQKYYPALQFNVSDSTVIVPRENKGREKLSYAADKELTRIKFSTNSSEKSPLIKELFLHGFKVEKDQDRSVLILESDRVLIHMLPAEWLSMKIKAMEMD